MEWRWRGGDRRQQQEVSMEKKKKKIKGCSRCGLHFGETAHFTALTCKFFFLYVKICHVI